jgi:integrase
MFTAMTRVAGVIRLKANPAPSGTTTTIFHVWEGIATGSPAVMGTMQRACRELGFRPLTHQDLRHVFATWCVEQGIDVSTVADILGHRDGGKLLLHRYRHLRMDHLKVVAAKMKF